MDKIKIVRLQSGEDVLCEYTESDDGFVTLSNPFCFIIRRSGDYKSKILMTPWLPIDVIEHNVAQVYTTDILTIMTPTKVIKEYYHKMVFEYHNGPSDLPEVEHPDNILLENDLIDTEEFYDDYLDEETQDKQSIDDTPETIH
jgi:hypothetical protein